MRNRKLIIICVVAAIIFSFVLIGYFASQISAVYPPIKEYNFSLSTNKLVNKINKIAADDTNLNFHLTDTTGTSTDFKYYADVYLKNNTASYTFNIFFIEPDRKHSKIGLVGAFDNAHKFGGYQNNSKDMQKLIIIFENNFVDIINRN